VAGLAFAFGIAALCVSGRAPVVFADTVQVSGPEVRLGELADLAGLPAALRARATQVEVARFAPGQRQLTLSVETLSASARARLPALAGVLPTPAAGTVTVTRPPAAQGDPPPIRLQACVRLRRPLAADAVLAVDDAEAAVCAAPSAAFRYDPSLGLARATRNLAPGELVAAPAVAAMASAAPGARLYLATQVGPVRVEREVIVVQPARGGEALFVQGAVGGVFAVPAPQARP